MNSNVNSKIVQPEEMPALICDSSETKNEKIEKDESPKDSKNYPENVQTAKERECYRLYQKMASMGLNVSYDTVLRGMLTPTELRVIQKKKDIELARQATLERLQAEQQELDEKNGVSPSVTISNEHDS